VDALFQSIQKVVYPRLSTVWTGWAFPPPCDHSTVTTGTKKRSTIRSIGLDGVVFLIPQSCGAGSKSRRAPDTVWEAVTVFAGSRTGGVKNGASVSRAAAPAGSNFAA